MKYHIFRIIMALLGIGIISLVISASGDHNMSEAVGGYILAYAVYGLFYMCTYPSIGRYYQIISLWSSIPGVSIVGWVVLTLLLVVLSLAVIPLSLVWHTFGAIRCLCK